MSHLDFIKTNKASFCEVRKLSACILAARRGRAWYQAIGWQILPVTWAQYTGWLNAHLWCIEYAGDAWIEGLHVHLLFCLCMTNSRVGSLQPSHIKIKIKCTRKPWTTWPRPAVSWLLNKYYVPCTMTLREPIQSVFWNSVVGLCVVVPLASISVTLELSRKH